jgi:glutathione S-transferase
MVSGCAVDWERTRGFDEMFLDQLVEVDPYQKPKELVELSPKGLVPALRLNNHTPPRALNESTVILEFLEE